MRAVDHNSAHPSGSSGHRQPRQPLTTVEILELDRALVGVFQTIREYRGRNPVARHIKFPSLPSAFSESIVIAATPKLFGPSWRGRHGGHVADVIVENVETHEERGVEVKATGQHAFQELKEKDLGADTLVWIRFGRRFEEGTGPVEVVLLDSPGKFIHSPCRLDTRRFEAVPGIQQNLRAFQFASIEMMLVAPTCPLPATRTGL